MSQSNSNIATPQTSENRTVIMVLALMVSLFMGLLYAFSVFITPLETTFGWQRHQTAMTFSFVMVFFSLGMLTGGNIMAKLGPGKTVALGGILAASGFLIASFTPNLYVLYFGYGILGGYGIGVSNLVPTSVLIRWFPDKRGLAMGLVTMLLALGTFFLGTKLAGSLVVSHGWPLTFRVIAISFFVVVSGCGFFLKFPAPGYRPKNWTPPAGQADIWGYNRNNVLKTSACWLICLYMLSIQLGGLMVIGHVVPFATEQGVERSKAVMVMGLYALANGVGRLFFGWCSDKFGIKISMVLDCIFMGAGLLGMIYIFRALGYPGLVISVCLVGFGYAGTVPLAALLVNSCFGPKFFPINYGMFTIPGAIFGGILGPMLGGFIQSQTGSYTIAILIAASLSIVGIVVSVLLKPPARRTDEVSAAPKAAAA
ncbi:MAG: MFS transporter [Deltaproteobacteria bacterium]|jgi:OFA family oxalate/formate antiporter-like MFS transporter|nr:MFS transporter [Deltaproteobacteria bacterium]